MIASPVCGFVELNPLTMHGLLHGGWIPLSLSEPFHWSSAMSLAAAAVVVSLGVRRASCAGGGPTDSVQATARSATATRTRRAGNVGCWRMRPSPDRVCVQPSGYMCKRGAKANGGAIGLGCRGAAVASALQVLRG